MFQTQVNQLLYVYFCHYFTYHVAGLHCSAILERLNDLLPSSLSRIHSNLASVLSLIHASPESPAWDHYLHKTEDQVTEGITNMVLTAVGSLLHRAHLYEQVPKPSVCIFLQVCTYIIFYISGCFHTSSDGSAAGAGRGCGHLLSPSHPSLLPPLHPGDSCQVDGQLRDHHTPTTQNPPQQPGGLHGLSCVYSTCIIVYVHDVQIYLVHSAMYFILNVHLSEC